MKSIFSIVLLAFTVTLCSFTKSNDSIIQVRATGATFTNWLEYEVLTKGEQKIKIEISHQSGKVVFQEERLLYGEAYLELDASEFPKGRYNIKAVCKGMESSVLIEKI